MNKTSLSSLTSRLSTESESLAHIVLNRFNSVQLFEPLWTMALRHLCPWDFPGKNTGVSCRALLPGHQTQGSNPDLLHCRQILFLVRHQVSPGAHIGLCQMCVQRRRSEERVTQRPWGFLLPQEDPTKPSCAHVWDRV